MSYQNVRNSVTNLLNRSGVRLKRVTMEGVEEEQHKRTEIMADHAFRKYFSSTLETGGVNPVYVEILLGHDMGLKTVHSKPTPTQLLEGNGDRVLGYKSGIDALTINEENRLRKQVGQMKAEASSVTALSERLSGLVIDKGQSDKSALAKELFRAGIFTPNQ